MNEIIKKIEAEQLKAEVPQFRVGDTVRVYGKIKEGNRERIQVFEGVVLKKDVYKRQVLVWLGEPEPERKKQLAELLEKQGFRMLAEFSIEKEMGEAQAGELALGIRRKLEEL